MQEKGKIYEGTMFIGIKPNKNHSYETLVINHKTSDNDDNNKHLFDIGTPIILSRFKQTIKIGDRLIFPEKDLTPLNLITATTDKKIYQQNESVNIFICNPGKPKTNAIIELKRNEQPLLEENIKLDEQGTYFRTLNDLYDGTYRITVTQEKNTSNTTFEIASYTLSYLQANLLSHSYNNGIFDAALRITAGGMPWNGELSVNLFCKYCDKIIETQTLTARQGELPVSFNFNEHTGPFSIILTTPEGDSASVPLPGTQAESRESLKIVEMGQIVTGSILPAPSMTERVRGIYNNSTGTMSSLVQLENYIGTTTRIKFLADFDFVLMTFYNPAEDSIITKERKNVTKGENFDLEIPYPITFFSLGALGENCYEYYALLIQPENMNLIIDAPDKAKPGSQVDIKVTSKRSGKLMLIVADSRLERDEPYDKVTENLFGNIRKNLAGIKSGEISEYKPRIENMKNTPTGYFDFSIPGGGFGGIPISRSFAAVSYSMVQDEAVDYAFEEFAGTPGMKMDSTISFTQDSKEDLFREDDSLQSSTRLDFPEIISVELTDFSGELLRTVKLGDQLTTYTIYAFLIDSLDYSSAIKRIEASQEVFVELDLPALLSPGDEITGKAKVSCPHKGKVEIRTSREVIQQEVSGNAVIEIPLQTAGEVMAEIQTPSWKDTTSRTIGIPGRETVTVSDLKFLEKGEVLEAGRIIVYPGPAYYMKESVNALIKYPFGCAEQTSAKIFGLSLVSRAISRKLVQNGDDGGNVSMLIRQGLDRMRLFYREGLFSLWENGKTSKNVTAQVLRNLVHVKDIDSPNDLRKMIKESVAELLKKNYKDNQLIPYSPDFAGEMHSVKDAALFYQQGLSRELAVKLVKNKAQIQGSLARWHDNSCWAGETEATAYALQVLDKEDRELFEKGFAFLSGKLQNGQLYTTTDTCAFLELLDNMEEYPPVMRAVIDNQEAVISGPVLCSKVEALSRTFIRIDSEKVIDHLETRADFEGCLEIDRTSLSLGERTRITVTPKEETQAPLVRVYLPGNVAAITSGAGIQKLYRPITDSNFTLDLYGIRRGRGTIHVVLHDMYNQEKIGVLPGLTIYVK